MAHFPPKWAKLGCVEKLTGQIGYEPNPPHQCAIDTEGV